MPLIFLCILCNQGPDFMNRKIVFELHKLSFHLSFFKKAAFKFLPTVTVTITVPLSLVPSR